MGSLQDQLADYENLKKQNELYKDALELKEENPDYTFVEAKAISRDAADIFGSYTINKGSASGIKDGDAVLYGNYIVGIIDRAYPTYSVVKTILDPDFSVSAYEIVSGEISYVTGRAELAPEGKCIMANLDSSTAVTYGSKDSGGTDHRHCGRNTGRHGFRCILCGHSARSRCKQHF